MENANLLDALMKFGLFSRRAAETAGVRAEEIDLRLSILPAGSYVETVKGWIAIDDEDNGAVRTAMKIAGALHFVSVPLSDVAKAMIKAMEYGAYKAGEGRNRKVGKMVGDIHDDFPDEASCAAVCRYVGATISSTGMVDFGPADKWIEPKGRGADLLSKLLLRSVPVATSSWLSRRMESRPARSTLDFTLLPALPYVLKEKNMPVRLLGVAVPDNERGRNNAETFVGMRLSANGNLVRLEYNLNEEAVEGNSFNVRPDCKELVHGEYVEVRTQSKVWFDMYGKDARKFYGIGVVVRKSYPNYENSETAFVYLDRKNRMALVDVGLRHERRFEARAEAIMTAGSLATSFPMAA